MSEHSTKVNASCGGDRPPAHRTIEHSIVAGSANANVTARREEDARVARQTNAAKPHSVLIFQKFFHSSHLSFFFTEFDEEVETRYTVQAFDDVRERLGAIVHVSL